MNYYIHLLIVVFHWHLLLSALYTLLRVYQFTFRTNERLNKVVEDKKDDMSSAIEDFMLTTGFSTRTTEKILFVLCSMVWFIGTVVHFTYISSSLKSVKRWLKKEK